MFSKQECNAQGNNFETQLLYFGEEFVNRRDRFTVAYESINVRRVFKMLILPKRLDVLEIGPGSGALMNYFAMHGHQVTGLEISPAVALSIKNRHGFNVVVETLEEHLHRVGKDRYDLVIMCHVLEHMEKPLESVSTCVNLLKGGGRVYISVPNIDSWHRRWSGWAGYEPYHMQYFSRSSLETLALHAKLGRWKLFSYESLSGWSNTIYWTVVKDRSGKMARNRTYPHTNVYRTFLEIARFSLGIVSSPLRWVQASMVRGEELILIGDKK